MKKLFFLILVVPLTYLLMGFRNICVFTLDEASKLKVDSQFIGKWRIAEDPDEQAVFSVNRYGSAQYQVTYISGSGVVKEFSNATAQISEIKGTKFLNLSYVQEKMTGYLIIKLSDIDSANGKMTGLMVADSTLETLDSRVELRDYISKNVDNSAIYGTPFHLQKIK